MYSTINELVDELLGFCINSTEISFCIHLKKNEYHIFIT